MQDGVFDASCLVNLLLVHGLHLLHLFLHLTNLAIKHLYLMLGLLLFLRYLVPHLSLLLPNLRYLPLEFSNLLFISDVLIVGILEISFLFGYLLGCLAILLLID